MRPRLGLVTASLAIAASFMLAGTASSKSVEPFSFSLGNSLASCEVESTEPLVRDTMFIFGTGALTQHSFLIERAYNPNTLRGTMTAQLSGTGPNIHRGTLHGVITPEGMSGTIQMTRFREDGLTDKFVGKWFAEGSPDTACQSGGSLPSSFTFHFEGHFIIS
jgi:hypothetical protein